jgi:hypothetical protein
VSIAADNNTSASAICVLPYQNSPHGQVTTTAGRPTAVLVQGLIHIGPEGSQGQQSPDQYCGRNRNRQGEEQHAGRSPKTFPSERLHLTDAWHAPKFLSSIAARSVRELHHQTRFLNCPSIRRTSCCEMNETFEYHSSKPSALSKCVADATIAYARSASNMLFPNRRRHAGPRVLVRLRDFLFLPSLPFPGCTFHAATGRTKYEPSSRKTGLR